MTDKYLASRTRIGVKMRWIWRLTRHARSGLRLIRGRGLARG